MGEDQFIDPESDFSSDKNNYEEIVINQIRKTADALSKDLTMILVTDAKGGFSHKEDLRKVAINHIKTLNGLIHPFISGKKEDGTIEEIQEEIETYLKEFGEQKIMIPGKGNISVSNMVHNVDSIHYNKLMEYKMDMFRHIFDVLVLAYKKYKDEIASFSIE